MNQYYIDINNYINREYITFNIPKNCGSSGWIGPYGIIISRKVHIVRAPDGVNYIGPYGYTTNVTTNRTLTKEQYLSLYAIKIENKWYYKKNY